MAQAVAGWYPDPSGATGKRYWDGTTWTEPVDALPKKAYTSWISRVVAAIADLFVFSIIARIANSVLDVVLSRSCTAGPDSSWSLCTLPGNVIRVIIGLAVLAFLIWNGFYRQGRTGSSIGKSVLKFKVVSERTGQPIGFGLSVVRWLAHFLDLIYFIGFLLPLFTAKRQTIADMIMKTVCLPIEATLAPPQQPSERRSRTPWIIGGAAAVLVWIVTVVAVVFTGHQSAAPRQVVLPFTGLDQPEGVAVDSAGNIYVSDVSNNRVLKLAAGSSTQNVLPFTGLNGLAGVTVDSAGNVYVAEPEGNRVLKLAAGSSTQAVLPFTGLNDPAGVAVDSAGNIYVTDFHNNRVLKLAAGSSTQNVLPFTGLNGPAGVTVDSAGNVYVAEPEGNRVVKLAAGSSTQAALPFTGLNDPAGVAVDSAGTVYVADRGNNRVLKLAAGSTTPTSLQGVTASGVAVDNTGNLYVADQGNNRVVKLAAG
jgi:DNA-binding beta-propeller fold protein YncE/uncharacterized RDD family membrane protein YckC